MPPSLFLYFFFNHSATTEIYTLSLHDALPISCCPCAALYSAVKGPGSQISPSSAGISSTSAPTCSMNSTISRSEEHTSELQSHVNLVCRLLLEKKKESTTS